MTGVDVTGVDGPQPEPEGFVLPAAWAGRARQPIRFVLPESRRPWNWLDLDHDQATILWRVLGEFVEYLNRRYLERAEQRVPPCWAEHGPLVEELTTLVFARWHAFESGHASIGGAQFWHTYTLPGFVDRMSRWLGPDRLRRCQAGRHEERAVDEPAQLEHWCRRRQAIGEADASLRPVRAWQSPDGAPEDPEFAGRDGASAMKMGHVHGVGAEPEDEPDDEPDGGG